MTYYASPRAALRSVLERAAVVLLIVGCALAAGYVVVTLVEGSDLEREP